MVRQSGNSYKFILYQDDLYVSILKGRFYNSFLMPISRGLGEAKSEMLKLIQLVIFNSRKVIGFIAILLMVVGCHRRAPDLYSTKETDVLPTRAASANDPGAQHTLRRLLKRGVKVISIGQLYLISIPADSIFGNQSPRIRWESYALLNDVVCYLKQFQKIGVDVTAFSSQYVSPARERALTSARAAAVADYLWTQNIDSRFVFTRGLGSDKPIFFNRSGGDDSLNSRVEITFRNEVE